MKREFFKRRFVLFLICLTGISAACGGEKKVIRVEPTGQSSNVSTAHPETSLANSAVDSAKNANIAVDKSVIDKNEVAKNETTKSEAAPSSPSSPTASEPSELAKKAKFYAALEKSLSKQGKNIEQICRQNDYVAKRILAEYGAVFLGTESVKRPPTCIFTSAQEVDSFQSGAKPTAAEIKGIRIELQPAALEAYQKARAEAQSQGLDITPRDGSEAARRSFDDTIRLWKSRFEPALAHWQRKGKITAADAERIKNLALREQVNEVLQLEERGLFFSKDFSKSILFSVAAPGASQHLSMLALDVEQFGNKKVRDILARHGWFRTVRNDAPHFTFLGVAENNLPALGLKKHDMNDGEFWLPDV